MALPAIAGQVSLSQSACSAKPIADTSEGWLLPAIATIALKIA